MTLVQIRSTGTVTSVNAAEIVRIDCRDGVGAVSSSGTIGTVRGPILSGNITAAGTISAVVIENWNGGASPQDYSSTISSSGGSITTVQGTTARMRGTVTADQGSIGSVIVSSSGIGPATGTPSTIRARDGIFHVEAVSINADVNCTFGGGSGQIQTLRTTSGNFSGSLQAAALGPFGTGVSIAGALSAPITITGNVEKAITVSGAVSSAVALSGTVSQPVTLSGGIGGGSFSTGPLASALTISGSPAASITLNSIAANGSLSIASDLPLSRTLSITNSASGPVTIGGSLLGSVQIGGSLLAPFKVGGSLSGTVTVGSSGTPGLGNQVMVNATNGIGVWTTGTVRVGGAFGTLIAPRPYYANLSSTLGGGAVGLVPFNLHKEDSLPVNGSGACSYPSRNWVNCGSGSTDIRDTLVLRHYGPIVDQFPGGALPVKVERQSLVQQCNPNCTPAPWEDVSDQVDVCVAPTEGGTPRPRELWIARKPVNGVAQTWWGGYQIQVTLLPNSTNPDLRSASTLAANAPIIAGYPYSFGTLCDELLGLSAGGWTDDDIAAWGATPIDLNNDGVADASDLALLVNLVTQTEQGGGWGNPPTE